MKNTFLSCSSDCDAELLFPAIPAEQDCTNYSVELSQVSDLYIIPTGAGDIFASWSTTPTAVANAIDNTEALNAKAKWLVGIGGIGAPEKATTEYPKLKSKTTSRVYTLEMTILQMTGGMYEFLRKMQCGTTSFKFYYADIAGFVFGKAGGITPSFVDVDFPKGAGNADTNRAVLTLKFEADGDPDRKPNPLA